VEFVPGDRSGIYTCVIPNKRRRSELTPPTSTPTRRTRATTGSSPRGASISTTGPSSSSPSVRSPQTLGNSLIPSVIRTHTPKPMTSTIRGTTPIRLAPLFSLLALPINEATQSCCCTQIVGVASSAPVVGTPRVNRTGRSTSHIVSRYCVSK